MARNDCWGIEVGADAVKAVRLVRKGGQITLAEHDVLPFKQVLTTPDIDVDEQIQVQLDQFLQRHDLRRSAVWAAVPGHMGFARFAKLPPVEPKKVGDIVKFEAVQQIPFPIDQVEWDYHVFRQPDSPDVEVGIFAMGKERVARFLQNYEAVGLKVDGITLSPVAVFNALVYDQQAEADGDGVVFVDIGSTSTDVVVAWEGAMWIRTLQIGGNDFTEALVKAFKLSFPKAEKLKREAATSKYARQIFQAMRPVFADLVQELQRSLGYFQSLKRDARLTKMVGVGSTFRLPGLTKFLKQQLQMDVQRLGGFAKIGVQGKDEAEFAESAMNLATAYGLALQGLGEARVGVNLLPATVRQARMWKAKQPVFAAAAAIVLLAVGLNVLTLWQARGQYDPSRFSEVNVVLNQARELDGQWRQVAEEADPREDIERLRSLLEGRSVWPLLLADLQLAKLAANPQPETLQADYEKIAAIPRTERRQIYITSVQADYLVGPGRIAGGSPAGTGAMMRRGGDEPAWTTNPWAAGQGQAPAFRIVVRGTTPHKDGVSFFTDTFIQWLRDHAEREDRPYRILVTGQSLQTFDKVTDAGAGRSPTTRSGTSPGMPFAGLPPPPDMGMSAPMPRRGGSGLDEVFPRRPLAEESRGTDWRFEVQWTIELLQPDRARQAEDALFRPDEPGRRSADTEAEPAQTRRGQEDRS
jgi:type IV pilus assembly protein PilM